MSKSLANKQKRRLRYAHLAALIVIGTIVCGGCSGRFQRPKMTTNGCDSWSERSKIEALSSNNDVATPSSGIPKPVSRETIDSSSTAETKPPRTNALRSEANPTVTSDIRSHPKLNTHDAKADGRFKSPSEPPIQEVAWQEQTERLVKVDSTDRILNPPNNRISLSIPDSTTETLPNYNVSSDGKRISVQAFNAPVDDLLRLIAKQQGLNIASQNIVDKYVSTTLKDVSVDEALNAILGVSGCTWTQLNDIIFVTEFSAAQDIEVSAAIQGRHVRVYNLNHIRSEDIEETVKGLLSPVGKVFYRDIGDNVRQAREQLVVEDLVSYLDRIDEYLLQTDIPPRQVQVEAHILQVDLKGNLRHGINFNQMLRASNSTVSLETSDFASTTGPRTILQIKGTDLNALLEAIKTSTDAKTIASPRLTAVNGLESRMQAGAKIGFQQTTTTQTSTLQSVGFLDVGVILSVTPLITSDNQIMLQVNVQNSASQINPTSNLPDSEVTEIRTNVILADGEALVIGGLIQEKNSDSKIKVPWLGDFPRFGRLFRKRELQQERSELIIALVPRIITDLPGCRTDNPVDIDRASTPLFHGPLHPNDRRMWEPALDY